MAFEELVTSPVIRVALAQEGHGRAAAEGETNPASVDTVEYALTTAIATDTARYTEAERALEALVERGLVEREGRSQVVVPDVFLRHWLRLPSRIDPRSR